MNRKKFLEAFNSYIVNKTADMAEIGKLSETKTRLDLITRNVKEVVDRDNIAWKLYDNEVNWKNYELEVQRREEEWVKARQEKMQYVMPNMRSKRSSLKERQQENENEEIVIEVPKPVTVYWGTACTGAPHLGYLYPLIKVKDFLDAKLHVKILFADVHAALEQVPFEKIEARTEFYKIVIRSILDHCLELENPKHVETITGSKFQFSREYLQDFYELTARTTTKQAIHAGSAVVKGSSSPYISGLAYPLMQALDEHHLEADIQFGGIDQRKIFMFAREKLPELDLQKNSYIMNGIIPGLTKEGKMSASNPNSKIELFDSDERIAEKIFASPAIDFNADYESPIDAANDVASLAILKYILFPQQSFRLRLEDAEFDNFDSLYEAVVEEKAFSDEQLKQAIIEPICELIEPVRKNIIAAKDLYEFAYDQELPL
mmetsp:Transcript_2661/g.3831  ORF Transcript_2661/g.3831 Transcript_2661/m.3831 type:complete len:432 (-) Transcript_2661:1163-2458(-)